VQRTSLLLAQDCRVGRRDRSTAIWDAPDVLPTWSQGQVVTHNGLKRARDARYH